MNEEFFWEQLGSTFCDVLFNNFREKFNEVAEQNAIRKLVYNFFRSKFRNINTDEIDKNFDYSGLFEYIVSEDTTGKITQCVTEIDTEKRQRIEKEIINTAIRTSYSSDRYSQEFIKNFVKGILEKSEEYYTDKISNEEKVMFVSLARVIIEYIKQNSDTNDYEKSISIDTISIPSPPKDPFPSHLLYKDESKKGDISYNIIEDDISYILENKHLVIYGEGGLGKSIYLLSLARDAQKSGKFSEVLYAALPSIGDYANQNNSLPQTVVERFTNISNNCTFSYIAKFGNWKNPNRKYENIYDCASNEEKPPVLLLLDGLNELQSAANNASSTVIWEISSLSQIFSNLCIVITNRSETHAFNQFKTVTITGTPEDKCEELAKKYNNDSFIKEIIKIPMYYNMLKDLPESEQPKTKYDILDKSYKRFMENANLYNGKEECKQFLYYIIAPKIANLMAVKRIYYISYEKIIEHIECLISDFNIKYNSYYVSILSLYDFLNINNIQETIKHKSAGDFFTMLEHHNILTRTGSNNWKFIHQDWQDYLAAKSIIADYLLLNKEFNQENQTEDIMNEYHNSSLCRYIDINLNIPDTVNEMILEGLEITGEITNRNSKLKEIISQNLNCNTSLWPSQITIQYSEMMCQISECLGNEKISEDTKEVLHDFLHKTFILCVETKDPAYIHQITENGCVQYVVNILAKEVEYYRRHTMYQDAIKWLDFGKLLNDNDLKLANQEGKVYLHCFESHQSKKIIKQDLLDEIEELFKKGYDIIKYCASQHFNMSSNLLGMMLSTPAPYLNNITISYVDAFFTYFNVAAYEKDKFYGKQLSYSVRQAASLIIKGCVVINTEHDTFVEYIMNNHNLVIEGGKKSRRITRGGWTLAKNLLDRIPGDNLVFTDYLRGCVELFRDRKDSARSFFKKENGVLSNIRLKYEFDESINIEDDIVRLFNSSKSEEHKYGEMDRCHPKYFYEDAKNLLLEYDPETKLFERIENIKE